MLIVKDFRNKKAIWGVLTSPVSLGVLLIVSGLIVRGDLNLLQKEKQSKVALLSAEKELGSLRERKTALESKIARLATEKGEEAEIRDGWSVGKAGEKLIVIVDDPKKEETPAETPPQSIWQKIVSFFK